jgi:Spindle and kinetochore-associated protein 1
VLTQKYTLLAKPKGKLSDKLRRKQEQYMQQSVPEHEGGAFVTESELRGCPAVASRGEATAKSLINSLRQLKRVRPVRAAGVMTFVVVQ